MLRKNVLRQEFPSPNFDAIRFAMLVQGDADRYALGRFFSEDPPNSPLESWFAAVESSQIQTLLPSVPNRSRLIECGN